MKFNLVVEINDADIDAFVSDSLSTKTDVLNGINNTMHLGLSCIEGMITRQFGIDNIDSHVKKQLDKAWGETWGDNFPTEDQCPMDVIEHHAESYDFPINKDTIGFAKAMWNEGNLTEKLS